MAIFEIEDPGTQQIIKIEADREPTEQEAMEALTAFEVSPIPIVPRGGVGVPLAREEARAIAAQRMVERARQAGQTDIITRPELEQISRESGFPLGGIGEGLVFSTSQFPETLQGQIARATVGARQAASAAALGVPGAIGKVIEDLTLNEAQQRILGSEALRARAPEVAAGGELAGGLIPTGLVGRAVLRPGATLLERGLAGARVGAPIGGVIGAAGAIEESGTEAAPLEVALRSALGTGAGATIGAAIPTAIGAPAAIMGTIQRAISRGFRPDVITKATGLTGLTTQEGIEETLAVARPRIIESHGKVPQTVTEGIGAASKAETDLYNQSLTALKTAKEQGLVMKGQEAFQQVSDEISSIPTLLPEEATAFISKYERFSGDLDPLEGQNLLKRLNKELSLFYEKEGVSRSVAEANPEIAAKVKFRDSLSDQLDGMVKSITGKDESPYRDIGKVIEFRGGLRNTLNRTQRREGAEAVGAPELLEGGIPVTTRGLVARGARRAVRPFIRTDVEKLDSALRAVLKAGPRSSVSVDIGEELQTSLRQRFSPGAPPPASSIEDVIQDLIKTYPKDIQANPALARRVAEAELTQRTFP